MHMHTILTRTMETWHKTSLFCFTSQYVYALPTPSLIGSLMSREELNKRNYGLYLLSLCHHFQQNWANTSEKKKTKIYKCKNRKKNVLPFV